MTIVDEQPFKALVQKIMPQGRLREIRPLSGGMSAQMMAFEVEAATGHRQKFIWRSHQEEQLDPSSSAVAHEFRLLQITESLGLATPTPYFLDLSGEIFARPYLVIQYVEGQMLFAPVDLDDYVRQFAAHLAQIHRADYGNYDLSFLRGRGDGCAELGGKRPSNTHPTRHETHIRQTLAAYSPIPQRNPSTLLHGDYWPGNSLWHKDRLVAIIDWEDAAWGDPLIDLAISRLDIVWIFGIEAMHNFTQQYQALLPVDNTHLPYWDLCAALRFIRIFGHNLEAAGAYFIPFGRDDISEQAIQENFNYFVSQALARLNE